MSIIGCQKRDYSIEERVLNCSNLINWRKESKIDSCSKKGEKRRNDRKSLK